jgi:hypothetical protein
VFLDIGFRNDIFILYFLIFECIALCKFLVCYTFSLSWDILSSKPKTLIHFCILPLKVKEWLQNLGIGEHMPVVHDEDEADDVNVPPQSDDNSIRNR